MATLQKLRNNAGLLIAIVIGLALLAFVLGDLSKSSKVSFSGKSMNIATIFNKSVKYQDFEVKVNDYMNFWQMNSQRKPDENIRQAVRNEVWNNLVRNTIVKKESEKIGLSVSPKELYDRIQGRNPHYLVAQSPFFFNQETGRFDRSRLQQFISQFDQIEDEGVRNYWFFVEDMIEDDILYQKYNTLVSSSYYTTDLQLENNRTNSNKKVDFSFIKYPYTDIPDSTINISESDYKDFYKKHIDNFKQDASRDILYKVFYIQPTVKDRKDAFVEITDMKTEFAKAKDPIQYVNLYSDSTYKDVYYKKGELPHILDSFMFSSEEGDIYGPYEEAGAFKLARLLSINFIPDSVEARHILIDIKSQPKERAKEIADSLYDIVKSGGDFAQLAMIHSADKSNAAKGGDLGWFGPGQMVKPFNDSCFFGKVGGIYLVETRFGYHIVEVTNMASKNKNVRVAKVVKMIEPSRETHDSVYAIANAFAGRNNNIEDLKLSAQEKGYQLNAYNQLKELSRGIPGIADQARDLVRWVFEAEEGAVNPTIFEYNDIMIVVGVSKVREDGYMSIDDAKDLMYGKIINDKKAEKISAEFKANMNAGDLNSIAKALNLSVNSASNVSYLTYSVVGAGVDPMLPAAASNSEKDVIEGPVIGKEGVYLLMVTNIKENESNANDGGMIKKSIAGKYTNNNNAFEALKEVAKIDDNRAKFE